LLIIELLIIHRQCSSRINSTLPGESAEDAVRLYDCFVKNTGNSIVDPKEGELFVASSLREKRRSESGRSERAELEEWLANFKPKTKLGLKLVALSKLGLDNGEALLDADQIMKQLGRRRYDE
jgi:hypothetical protein